ncbi:dihydrodipicolinate synthase family protein [Crateriforma spongiae]|uniref:dihydrodipicolinate synthase family protein n=1 Tax=Crateriforma spongiae TaxID=2724528 RepID=UPI001444C066|nr:dihydrodipicolinate synthase family protein [Crateriforma spongiae]
MKTQPFQASDLPESVIAVPPLARDTDGVIDGDENDKIIRHLEAGGIRCLLYGGNAVLYHMRLTEYEDMLSLVADSAGPDTVVVPSVGPSFGLAMDQTDVLADYPFPTAMLLPSRDIVDQQGIAAGIRAISDALGKPIVLYIKFDQWLDPDVVRGLEDDGVISWIKYAVVRDDPSDDDYLRSLLDVFPAERMVSGIGEQPAIAHVRGFGLAGFTSGCVCIAPRRSMDMLGALQAGDLEVAETIRQSFRPLEDLRDSISPIRVLHHAVQLAGIAQTGPLLPMLSDLPSDQLDQIQNAVQQVSRHVSL